jgi:hypothetical protein
MRPTTTLRTTMLSAAMKSELLDLAAVIAPEISQPIYLMEHPSHLPMKTDSGGYTPTVTCALLKQHLVDRGEWYGPGPQIVIQSEPADAVFIHELAHCLPFKPWLDRLDIPAARKMRLAAVTREATEPTIPTDQPAWSGHGLGFIRTCLHLIYRCAEAGKPIDLRDIALAGATYGLSSPFAYQAALGDEPSEMMDATFEQICLTRPPERFSALFESDCQ